MRSTNLYCIIIFIYGRVTFEMIVVFLVKPKKFAMFESVSCALKLFYGLQIWTIGSFMSQLHMCQYVILDL